MTVEYTNRGDGALAWERPLGDDLTLTFAAWDVRKAPTGIHARLDIEVNGVSLAWSVFNIEKDEDRLRLANSAHKHLKAQGQPDRVPAEYLKHELDLFCKGLWNESLKGAMPELMEGTLEPAPPDFVLEPYVIRGGGTICFAPPGRGKSYVLLIMAISVDAGISSLWPVRQEPVLVINLERSAKSYRDRLSNVNAALGLPRNRPVHILNARGKRLEDVIESSRAYMRKFGIRTVFLDSISRAGYGDLNENAPVNRIADGLNGLCESWFALAHTPRSDESHVFGSVHFEAAADIMVQLLTEQEKPEDPLGIGLLITKQNDFGKRGMDIYRLDFTILGLTAVRCAKQGEFPAIEGRKPKTLKQKLVEYILDQGKASATDAAKALSASRQNISDIFNNDADFVRLPKEGKDQLFGVMFPERPRNGTGPS